jgi:hypothetical protein
VTGKLPVERRTEVDRLTAIDAIVRDAFEDVALLISATATLHHLDDQLVRTLVRRLGRVRERALHRLTRIDGRAGEARSPGRPCPLHPAVEGFLSRDQRARKGVPLAK